MPTISPSKADADDIRDMHFLIVDDDMVVLDLVEALLKSMGVTQITRAQSGRQAFATLIKNNKVVDCMLCDYRMSDGNGLQLLQTVRMGKVQFVRPDACFILVTSSGDPTTVTAAAELDVNGYLVKPINAQKLRAAIVKGRSRPIRIDTLAYARVNVPISD